VSAGLDALDCGVIEAGLSAAEALSRVGALEREVAGLRARITGILGEIRETAQAAGIAAADDPGTAYDAAAAVQARRREFRLVQAGGAR